MLEPRSVAPDFTLPDQDGTETSLSKQRGHWVVLYWYPKASTPGCTIQGQRLRDKFDDLRAADAVVLGASFDTPADNKAFADAEGFPFQLLSDTDRSVGATYEVIRPADDEYADYPMRLAYLIDPEGTIRRSYDVTDVNGFADVVLADLAALRSA